VVIASQLHQAPSSQQPPTSRLPMRFVLLSLSPPLSCCAFPTVPLPLCLYHYAFTTVPLPPPLSTRSIRPKLSRNPSSRTALRSPMSPPATWPPTCAERWRRSRRSLSAACPRPPSAPRSARSCLASASTTACCWAARNSAPALARVRPPLQDPPRQSVLACFLLCTGPCQLQPGMHQPAPSPLLNSQSSPGCFPPTMPPPPPPHTHTLGPGRLRQRPGLLPRLFLQPGRPRDLRRRARQLLGGIRRHPVARPALHVWRGVLRRSHHRQHGPALLHKLPAGGRPPSAWAGSEGADCDGGVGSKDRVQLLPVSCSRPIGVQWCVPRGLGQPAASLAACHVDVEAQHDPPQL
jgi:hypothetical protein